VPVDTPTTLPLPNVQPAPPPGMAGATALRPLDQLLVTRAQLSELTSLHVRTLARLDAAGEIPGRIKVGKSVRYDVAAIKEWIAVGCDMARWKALHRGKR